MLSYSLACIEEENYKSKSSRGHNLKKMEVARLAKEYFSAKARDKVCMAKVHPNRTRF